MILKTIELVAPYIENDENKTITANFWDIMELCDWSEEGDDEKVLAPVIQYLSRCEDNVIFSFHRTMIELLETMNEQRFIDQYVEERGYFSDDDFLDARCVALINGERYYKNALNDAGRMAWDLEFESLLYVPENAWAKKHQEDVSEYPQDMI